MEKEQRVTVEFTREFMDAFWDLVSAHKELAHNLTGVAESLHEIAESIRDGFEKE